MASRFPDIKLVTNDADFGTCWNARLHALPAAESAVYTKTLPRDVQEVTDIQGMVTGDGGRAFRSLQSVTPTLYTFLSSRPVLRT